jgi:uncharacterized protein YlxW (UPF0749 family)
MVARTVQSPGDHVWVWHVTALSIALGILLALAIRTTGRLRNSSVPGSRFGVSTAFLSRYKEHNLLLQRQIIELRRQVSDQVATADLDTQAAGALRKDFERLKEVAGLSAAQGPGLRLTVRDSLEAPVLSVPDYLVHDQDLNNLIAELKAAGAQHLAIAGADETNLQRVVVTTTARCVGPTAVVNGTPLSAPYHILAIGDPKRLRAALERPDGYIRVRELDARKMILIEEAAQLVLPEYSGTFKARYARPAD